MRKYKLGIVAIQQRSKTTKQEPWGKETGRLHTLRRTCRRRAFLSVNYLLRGQRRKQRNF